MSPTGRTLRWLRAEGWTAQVVELWIPRRNIRRDLWGVGDVLAMRPGEPLLLVQATSYANVSGRAAKAKLERGCGPGMRGRFEVWGWATVLRK